MKDIKNRLRAGDTNELPMDDAYYERLHDKIMASVSETEIQKVPSWQKPKKLIKDHWKNWVVSAGSLSMILIAALQAPMIAQNYFDESHVVQVLRNEDAFVAQTLDSPGSFSDTLISYQNDHDFFVDVAERSFHDLSQEHVREIMGEGRN